VLSHVFIKNPLPQGNPSIAKLTMLPRSGNTSLAKRHHASQKLVIIQVYHMAVTPLKNKIPRPLRVHRFFQKAAENNVF